MTDYSFLSLGSIVNDRYEIVRKFRDDGFNGFYENYLAIDRDKDHKKCVVTELMFPEHRKLESLEDKDLVDQEVKLVSHLRYPQIQTLQGSLWVENGKNESLLLIKDYIQGETYLDLLNHRLQHQQIFSEAEVVDFLFKILPVVDYIHRAGVKHSNISPENIICRDRDQLPVLINFRSFENLAKSIIHKRIIRRGGPSYSLWSPSYQSFEVSAGSIHIHPSSDLYALALTALSLLTGKHIDQIYYNYDVETLNFNIKELCEAVNLSPELVSILERSLQYDCRERYQSATAVIEALLPIATSTNPLSYRLGMGLGSSVDLD
jgi:serine/threonine protein kinase, bacterial